MKKTSYGIAFIIACVVGAITIFIKKTPIQPSNTLIIGTNANFPPFEYIKNGELTGFEIELVKEIAKVLQKEPVFKDIPFESLLIEAHSGRVQVIAAAMTPTIERSKQIFFTKPYLENDPLIVITLSDAQPKSLEDLKGKEVVVNEGYTAESFMIKQPDVIVQRLGSPAEAFFALTNGKCYAYVSARSAVQPFFDRYGTDTFNILTLPVSDSYALAVPKAFPELFEHINNALETLQNNGTLENLKKKWHLHFK